MVAPKTGVSKSAFDKLSGRVGALEKSMSTMETTMTTLDADVKAVRSVAQEAAENTAQLLAIATATKGAAAFFTKHGPRIIAFLTGLLAAGEIGDPKIISFLQSFFA